MVSCYNCMKKLPDECTCPITKRTKIMHWIDNAHRELQIIKQIYVEKLAPRVLVGKEVFTPEVVEVSNGVILRVKINPTDWRRVRSIILLDADGIPLYRKTRRFLGVKLKKGDSATVEWSLGW